MPVFNNALAGAAGQSGGAADFKIERSLRFNSADGAYISRAQNTEPDRDHWTYSFWVKRNKLGTEQTLLRVNNGGTDTNNMSTIDFRTDDKLQYYVVNGGTLKVNKITNQVFRDVSAWYHIIVSLDLPTLRIWVNGVQIQDSDLGTNSPNDSSYVSWIGRAETMLIGRNLTNGSVYGDFTLAETHFLEGIAVTNPDAFGEFDDDTGVWNPIAYTGTYGTNGFYLDFDPTAGVVYSDAVQNAGNAATNLFDGSVSSYTEGSTDGTAVTWTGNVSGNTIEFYGAQVAGTRSFSVNGVDRLSLVPTTAGWFTIPNTTSLTSFSFSRGQPSGGFVDLYAIRVDGKILVDHEFPGVDASGNGNNWTGNNISTFPNAGAYVSQVSGSDYNSNYSKVKMFDSSTTSGAYLAGDSSQVTWTIPGGLAFSSSLRVKAQHTSGGGTMTFNWSGGSYNLAVNDTGQADWYNVTSNVTSPITSVTWTTGAGAIGPYVNAWEVDGSTLLDTSQTTGEDSLLDSPTNYEASSGNNGGNYCTLNVLAKSSNITLSQGSLRVTSNNNQHHAVLGTFALSSGKWYYEMVLESGVAAPDIGWHEVDYTAAQLQNFGGSTRPGGYCISTDGNNNNIRSYNNGTMTTISATSWATGDVIGCAIDMDAKKIWFRRNGSAWYAATSGGTSGNPVTGANPTLAYSYSGFLTPRTSTYGNSYTPVINFGARSFAYAPPTGFKSLCTTNLDDPLIAKGSDHFDTSLWTGNDQQMTVGGQIFSSGTLTGSIHSGNPITNAFDGDTSTGTWAGSSSGFELTFPSA